MDHVKKDRKFRIFVVDDEEIISSTIAAILRLKGFEAVSFTQPLQALETSRLQVPDLLVSDIVMPLVTGIDLASRLQALHPNCKALLFSGEWGGADFSGTGRQPTCEFEIIPKPVHPQDLLRKVHEILAVADGPPDNRENRAQARVAENMKETVAAVRADIATSSLRQRSARRRTQRDREK